MKILKMQSTPEETMAHLYNEFMTHGDVRLEACEHTRHIFTLLEKSNKWTNAVREHFMRETNYFRVVIAFRGFHGVQNRAITITKDY
jgi:hypothetical protein